MAAIYTGTEWTVTATATSLTTILGGTRLFLNHITVRAGSANVGNVFFGGSNVTTGANRRGFLKPEESFAIALEGPYFSSDDLFFIGTASDKLHVSVLS